MYKRTDPIIKPIKRLKTVKKAHFKYVDTGKKHVVHQPDGAGNLIPVEQNLKERIFVEAMKEEVTEDKIYHGVEVIATGEVHEFASAKEADTFIKESR